MSFRNSEERTVENFIIIWLDPNLNESATDFQDSINQLRRFVNSIKTFIDVDECIDYLTDIKNEKIFLIISGTLGEQLVPAIQPISHLYAVYILCHDTTTDEQWIKNYYKVKGVFIEIESLCDILKEDTHQADINSLPISIIPASATLDLNQLDQSFMYSQLLKEILLKIKYNDKLKEEFIDFCLIQHVENESALRVIDEFDQDYHRKSPIWWYTRDCFIYSMLNKALRTQDIEIILKMGFFIRDLHQEIQRLYSKRDDRNSLTVYRGQGINNMEFEKMKHSQGALLSFNNFLSTSVDRRVSFSYADSARDDPELTGVLFKIEIDPSISTTPFASLDHVSYFSDSEEEILFSMHTIFRIDEINKIKDRLWEIKLRLTNDNDEQLKLLTDYLYKEIGQEKEGTEWNQLASLMLKMGEYNKAVEIYNTIYASMPDTSLQNLAGFHNNMAVAMSEKGDQRTALSHQTKALELLNKYLHPAHPDLAVAHNSIGSIYVPLGEYSTALSHYAKALEIRQKSLSPYHPTVAITFNNIGIAYQSMGNYSAALLNYNKALEVYEKSHPFNHPARGLLHSCIGTIHQQLGQHSAANSHYEKALQILEKTLPSYHPDLGVLHNNLALYHQSNRNLPVALEHHKKALNIRQKSLSPDHPGIAMSLNNLGLLYFYLGQPSNALSHLQQALQIYEKSVPPNHPERAAPHNNIAMVYLSLREYSIALQHCTEALKIQQLSLRSDHPDRVSSHILIAEANKGLFKYDKAREHLLIALEISTRALEPNDHRVQIVRRELENLYPRMW